MRNLDLAALSTELHEPAWAPDLADPPMPDDVDADDFPDCTVCGGNGEVSRSASKAVVQVTCGHCNGSGTEPR